MMMEKLSSTLADLQLLQAAFDQGRGFDFPRLDSTESAPGNPDAEEATLRRIEFSTLALCGEAGELANLIKKIRRATWLDEPPDRFTGQAQRELGDLLAYLLKLTNLFGRDLEEIYLERVSENLLRFPCRTHAGQRPPMLSLAGPPGAGKTTVATALSAQAQTYVEIVEGNSHLPELAQPGGRFDAAANQHWFLAQLERFVGGLRPENPVAFDQDPAAVVHVYAKFFREEGMISASDYARLLRRLIDLEFQLGRWAQREVLLLDAPAEILKQRAERRAGAVALPLSWYQRLRSSFSGFREIVPGVQVIRTDELSIEETVVRARRLLKPLDGAPP
jgi:NTP pyrophosphatase (non-canonical NTP hydrolase)/deoxyadenosine/deoxycytidine kinase